jgi:hypothetical protein
MARLAGLGHVVRVLPAVLAEQLLVEGAAGDELAAAREAPREIPERDEGQDGDDDQADDDDPIVRL